VFLACGPVEHLMAMYSCLLRALPRSTGGWDVVRAFYTTWFQQVFRVTDYALWKAVLLQLSNFVATFTWSYVDMFVTLVSMALAHKYTQLYGRLAGVKGQVRREVRGGLCSNVRSSSLNVRDQASYPYRTTGKIIALYILTLGQADSTAEVTFL
jgi:hypothetical protein